MLEILTLLLTETTTLSKDLLLVRIRKTVNRNPPRKVERELKIVLLLREMMNRDLPRKAERELKIVLLLREMMNRDLQRKEERELKKAPLLKMNRNLLMHLRVCLLRRKKRRLSRLFWNRF